MERKLTILLTLFFLLYLVGCSKAENDLSSDTCLSSDSSSTIFPQMQDLAWGTVTIEDVFSPSGITNSPFKTDSIYVCCLAEDEWWWEVYILPKDLITISIEPKTEAVIFVEIELRYTGESEDRDYNNETLFHFTLRVTLNDKIVAWNLFSSGLTHSDEQGNKIDIYFEQELSIALDDNSFFTECGYPLGLYVVAINIYDENGEGYDNSFIIDHYQE